MKLLEKKQSDLKEKFQKVLDTPASFAFFVAIHDFIECIERTPAFARTLSSRSKINRELNIPARYAHLKQIYQGLEDVKASSREDLGHTRYMVIRELNQIQNNDVSDSNSFWKKRELLRRLVGEVYKRLKGGE